VFGNKIDKKGAVSEEALRRALGLEGVVGGKERPV
jgi:hypothetical protein